MKRWCIETPGIWLLTTRMKTAWELSSLPELLGSWFFFLTCKMRYSMIEFPIVYSCQHPQGSGMRSVTSPNRIESPHCWGNLCQGWRDSENFPEQPDSTVAFSPRNLVMKNFTMKHSIASKESLNRNGRSNLAEGRETEATLPKGGESWSQDEAKIPDSLRLFAWEWVTLEPSKQGWGAWRLSPIA